MACLWLPYVSGGTRAHVWWHAYSYGMPGVCLVLTEAMHVPRQVAADGNARVAADGNALAVANALAVDAIAVAQVATPTSCLTTCSAPLTGSTLRSAHSCLQHYVCSPGCPHPLSYAALSYAALSYAALSYAALSYARL